MTWRTVPGTDLVQQRLERIFPREAFDTTLSNPLAAKAIVAMIFVDAVADEQADLTRDTVHLAAPRHCIWMSEQTLVAAADDTDRRMAWFRAGNRGHPHSRVSELEAEWGLTHRAWASDNSRETLRDETFPGWLGHEALRVRHDITTSSSRGRYVLTAAFADLFDPELTSDDLAAAIDRWRDEHMDHNARFRANTVQRRQREAAGLTVVLPDGQTRPLEPGESSRILKAVIEEWAPRRLRDPEVLAISQPGDKVPDRQRLRDLGLTIDEGSLLPDALIIDIGAKHPEFWIIEIVASDGPITEHRRSQLLKWAADQNIDAAACRFLTAFAGRNSGPARRRLKDLAVETFAWYVDEPNHELSWRQIREPEHGSS